MIGANIINNKCVFTVWAPEKKTMVLHIVSPHEEYIKMDKDDWGYFHTEKPLSYINCRYYYRPDDESDFPDPASHYQPDGVNYPSQFIDQRFDWSDGEWRNIPLKDYIIYELHIGTFTDEGTFEAAIEQLGHLAELGVNAIEIMPVNQFSGAYNWGYDGVFPYAPQNSYGGYLGLKKLVNACHQQGIAVILDVVYNHMGPEGNCVSAFAPYFTDKYKTPWGQAINFDGTYCDGVREYFRNNALYWLEHFHIDALRLDAIHEMYDFSALHFWEYLHNGVHALSQRLGRNYYLIAESDLNNPKIVEHPEAGGYGFNAQWLDDFHHALYVLIHPKAQERYEDFGNIEQLAKAYTDGYVHSGEYVKFRKKKYGRSTAGLPGDRFIAFIQNHDQIGNSVDGSRLSKQINTSLLKVAAAAMLLSPYIPMLFMGEEYADDAPFNYFVDHQDKELIDAIRDGRKKEFEHDNWDIDPPDPKSRETFVASKLQWNKRTDSKHSQVLKWYKELISLRKARRALKNYDKNDVRVHILGNKAYALHRKSEDQQDELLAIFNLSEEQLNYLPLTQFNHWKKLLSSTENELYPTRLGNDAISIPGQSVAIYIKN